MENADNLYRIIEDAIPGEIFSGYQMPDAMFSLSETGSFRKSTADKISPGAAATAQDDDGLPL